jgi:ferredoxin|mmetsp:Transcript_13766/g.20519  ORF Transcript_13766/g.20519 Transcript_13766/m.20519 type:complete len:138 (-) Transcript_13766:82-495(-)|eukprot:scaffold23020_cov162-Skeletonema_marinoi.AAC.3
MKATTILSLFAAAAVPSATTAFTAAPTPIQRCQDARIQATQLNLFGNAFKNDDSLGKPQNAGLTNGPKINEVTINGKPVKAVAGQKVSKVMASARVKMTYSCQKGNCGTCEMLMNGRVEKACLAKIPQGKCTIQTYN